MKYFIFGLAVILICTFFAVFQQDYNLHELQMDKVKFVAEEAAAAAAQYYSYQKYSDGIFVFTQSEGVKAAEYIIKTNLNLDNNFNPNPNNYWTDKITYQIQFLDDESVSFPYQYTDADTGRIETIVSPTVTVKINCGKARYRVPYIQIIPPSIRQAAHEWKNRKP